jgi:hypothetical protein
MYETEPCRKKENMAKWEEEKRQRRILRSCRTGGSEPEGRKSDQY